MDIKLARVINKMAAEDQRMRKIVDKTGGWNEKIDKENTKKLKQIINKYGWPTIGLVGHRASRNAWLIAQHADKDLKFQRACLKLIKDIYVINPKDIDRQNIAFLTDRILAAEGKKQIFGTQFYTNKNGIFGLRPTKDLKNINTKRKEYNIWPIERDLKDAELFNKRSK